MAGLSKYSDGHKVYEDISINSEIIKENADEYDNNMNLYFLKM
jgi:hypothetical protein